ncbi:MAG: hypothetical protein J6V53_01820 [Alphaproteobacteria bacterium]|nr:hypothetical protein [Alphaproteobacteria bacterium]
MTDISTLLKEAKPLYVKRKKQRQMIKNTAVGITMCSLLLGFGFQNISSSKGIYQLDDLYMSLYDDEVFDSKYHLMVQETDVYPVDEFGLILVSA